MSKRSIRLKAPQRGEIWIVNFNSPINVPTPPDGTPRSQRPTTGDEINKARPAVVISMHEDWEYDLHIVVPLRRWRPRFLENGYFWIVQLPKNRVNNLRDDSGADTYQVKSVSTLRLYRRIGVVSSDQLHLIVDTVAFCIGFTPPQFR